MKKPLMVFLFVLLAGSAWGSEYFIGVSTTAGVTESSTGTICAKASWYVCAKTGTLDSFYFWANKNVINSYVIGMIYQDNNNAPTSLLGYTNSTLVTQGYNQMFFVNSITVVAGQKIWLATQSLAPTQTSAYLNNGDTNRNQFGPYNMYGNILDPYGAITARGSAFYVWYCTGVQYTPTPTATITPTPTQTPIPTATPTITPGYSCNDKMATSETVSTYEKLMDTSGNKIMIGQALNDNNSASRDAYNTDMQFYKVTGKRPKILGIDFYNASSLRSYVIHHYESGGINMMYWHMNNVVTGGSAWDNNSNIVVKILPGGTYRQAYLTMLDTLANYLLGLRDHRGRLIPVILRPFHEADGGWFWWGIYSCTPDQFRALWIDFVTYLRDVRGVHNALYCYSPELTNGFAYDGLLYPGDSYVDVLGLDYYAPTITYKYSWDSLNGCLNRLQIMSDLAAAKRKPFGLCEGLRNEFPNTVTTDPNAPGIYKNYWTEQFFNPIFSDSKARYASFISLWWSNPNTDANSNWGCGPFLNSLDSSSFIDLLNDSRIEFLEK